MVPRIPPFMFSRTWRLVHVTPTPKSCHSSGTEAGKWTIRRGEVRQGSEKMPGWQDQKSQRALQISVCLLLPL